MAFILEAYHRSGQYQARLTEDETAGWLYLLDSHNRIVSDVFVYNRIPPLDVEASGADIYRHYVKKNLQPPITHYYGYDHALIQPEESDVNIRWSDDGHAVYVAIKNKPMAFIIWKQKAGYSKAIKKEGPYGYVWNETLFGWYFGKTPKK